MWRGGIVPGRLEFFCWCSTADWCAVHRLCGTGTVYSPVLCAFASPVATSTLCKCIWPCACRKRVMHLRLYALSSPAQSYRLRASQSNRQAQPVAARQRCHALRPTPVDICMKRARHNRPLFQTATRFGARAPFRRLHILPMHPLPLATTAVRGHQAPRTCRPHRPPATAASNCNVAAEVCACTPDSVTRAVV